MEKHNNDFCLDKIFKEKTDYIGYTFDIYKKIYDLPLIQHVEEVSAELFEYASKRKYFVLLTIYDQDGKIFLERNISERSCWSLPGGSILRGEDMHSAVKRMSNQIHGHGTVRMPLGEIEPIAMVENEFRFNGNVYRHYGIAFAGRSRNKENLAEKDVEGRFVRITDEELKNINHYANREVVKICGRHIQKFKTSPPEEEISTNEKYKFRYFIHNAFVKRFILTPVLKKKKKFIETINMEVAGAASFIDVSCGDSNMIYELYDLNNFDYAIANDTSWSQINKKQGDGKRILFTNHNASYLPFKENSFDVAFCANTLHHIPTREGLFGLFDGCLKIAKKVVFVEIEKPGETGLLPHLLNKYWYGGFLKDAGGSYFTKNTFHAAISEFYKNKGTIKFSEFRNIQGKYLMAVVVRSDAMPATSKKIEVEGKYLLLNRDVLVGKLVQLGFKPSSSSEEKDEYFTGADGMFVKDRTCLRIRTKQGGAELTFKGKSRIISGSYAKVEHNAIISQDQVEEVKDILSALGYHKYVSVSKNRQTFTQNGEYLKKNVSIDELRGIGTFVELEILADHQKWQNRTEELHKILSELKTEIGGNNFEEAPLPYRDYSAEYLASDKLNKNHTVAFLFDFDGTIAHTETIFYNAYCKVAEKISGTKILADDYVQYELNDHDKLFHRTGLDKFISREEFMAAVYSEYRERLGEYASNEKIMESIDAIQKIRNLGYKVALITSSKIEFVTTLIPEEKLKNIFDCVVCREDFSATKPEPGLYIECVKKLNLKTDQCIAVADSVCGIRFAKEANLNYVVVRGDPLFRAWNRQDDYIFENLMEIALILENTAQNRA